MPRIAAYWVGPLVVVCGMGAAHGQAMALPAPNISRIVPADPMTLVAPENRHEFVAIDPAWTKVLHWQEPVPGQADSFFERDEDPHKDGTRREERYFDGDSSKPDEYRKFLLFSASGKLIFETDRESGKTWNRAWYADGTFASYSFSSSAQVFAAGVSVRKDRMAVSVFSGGTGAWLRWYAAKDGLEYQYWHHDKCLIQATFDTRCRQLSLDVEGGFLSLTPDMEWLAPPKRDEDWTLQKDSLSASVPTWSGEPAERPVALPADDIHRVVVNSQMSGRGWPGTPAVTRVQYDIRRSEFVAQYTALLKEHGLTWESLGLAKLRDMALTELPTPDPTWLALPVQLPAPRNP